MSFEIIYHPDVVDNDIPNLPKTMRGRIRRAIENRLTSEPASYGKPLKYNLKALWSLRVGDYRIIYRILDNDEVLILKIGHRRDVYK